MTTFANPGPVDSCLHGFVCDIRLSHFGVPKDSTYLDVFAIPNDSYALPEP